MLKSPNKENAFDKDIYVKNKQFHELSKFPDATMTWAASNGYLDAVKYFHKVCRKECATNAMDSAAANGFLEVVEYLYWIGARCTTNAMDRSAENGHLRMVKYLHVVVKAGCTTNAMDSAAKNGHFEIVKYLHEKVKATCTSDAVDWADTRNYTDIAKYLLEEVKVRGTARLTAKRVVYPMGSMTLTNENLDTKVILENSVLLYLI